MAVVRRIAAPLIAVLLTLALGTTLVVAVRSVRDQGATPGQATAAGGGESSSLEDRTGAGDDSAPPGTGTGTGTEAGAPPTTGAPPDSDGVDRARLADVVDRAMRTALVRHDQTRSAAIPLAEIGQGPIVPVRAVAPPLGSAPNDFTLEENLRAIAALVLAGEPVNAERFVPYLDPQVASERAGTLATLTSDLAVAGRRRLLGWWRPSSEASVRELVVTGGAASGDRALGAGVILRLYIVDGHIHDTERVPRILTAAPGSIGEGDLPTLP